MIAKDEKSSLISNNKSVKLIKTSLRDAKVKGVVCSENRRSSEKKSE